MAYLFIFFLFTPSLFPYLNMLSFRLSFGFSLRGGRVLSRNSKPACEVRPRQMILRGPLISKPGPLSLLLCPNPLIIFDVNKCTSGCVSTEMVSFCRSAHLFTLAALYLHTKTLKLGLGSHIWRPWDIHPDFRPNRGGLLSEAPWDGLENCRTRRP